MLKNDTNINRFEDSQTKKKDLGFRNGDFGLRNPIKYGLLRFYDIPKSEIHIPKSL
jgi:hypothetical protein